MPPSQFQFSFDVGVGASAEATPKQCAGAELTTDPTLYPIAFDADSAVVQLVELSKADYESASFLDSRLLRPGTRTHRRKWQDVRRAASELPARCHFIFHISHVGSTLLSRLIGQHPAFFSVREPALLRGFADTDVWKEQSKSVRDIADADDCLLCCLKLWSRVFDSQATAVIKATSFVAELADLLMAQVADSRSILMFVPPETFLRSLLDGAMSDITSKVARRMIRLRRRLGASDAGGAQLSAGESVAMSWLCEMLAMEAAAARFPGRVLWLDFDEFLKAPARCLIRVLEHLGATASEEFVRSIVSGPIMSAYAKAPSVPFDAAMRSQLLERSAQRHSSEIKKGLDWLQSIADRHAVVHQLLGARGLMRSRS